MPDPLYRQRPGGFDIRPAVEPAAVEVGPGIYLSEGLSNSYLVVTDEGRVVINTGMGFEGPVHREAFDAVDAGPIRAVILTQGHVDHVGGVDRFLEPGTEVIAQAGNAAHQADDARIARFRAMRSAFAFADAIRRAGEFASRRPEGPASQSRPEPTLCFEDAHRFELGGRRFELYATPGGETRDSLVVWLPRERICFTGNLFSALFGHFPNLVTVRGDRYREALAFVESLERVRALEPDVLLVGHHQPVRGAARVQAELTRLRDAVLYVHDATVRGMNEGKDVHTLMAEIALPPEIEVGEGYGKVAWGVRAIWETYAGWFHHRSATELYATPASAVHGDLVELAGGAGPVAERAAERLAADAPLEAVHLAEVALDAEPDHPAALRVAVEAHRRLEERSENFWLTSWLRKQIRSLEARLPQD